MAPTLAWPKALLWTLLAAVGVAPSAMVAKEKPVTADFLAGNSWTLYNPSESRASVSLLEEDQGKLLRIKLKDYFSEVEAVPRNAVEVDAKRSIYRVRYKVRVGKHGEDSPPAGVGTRFVFLDSKHPDDPAYSTFHTHVAIPSDGQWHEMEAIGDTDRVKDRLKVQFNIRAGLTEVDIRDVAIDKIERSYFRKQEPVPEPTPDGAQTTRAGEILEARVPADAALAREDRRLRLRLGGKLVAPLYVGSFANHADTTLPHTHWYQVGDFLRAGVRVRDVLVRTGVGPSRFWLGPDRYDFSAVDKAVMRILSIDPESHLIIRLDTNPYVEWGKEHPDDVMQAEGGRPFIVDEAFHTVGVGREPNPEVGEHLKPSYYSEKLAAETIRAIRALVRHINSQPYGRAVIGYHINGGSDATFRQPIESSELPDYSPAALAAFRRWLKERYGGDEALQEAWGNDRVTLATAAVPPVARRNTGAFFLNASRDRDVIDYEQFLSDGTADLQAAYARAIKEESGQEVLVGIYYVPYDLLSMGRLLETSDIDFYVGLLQGITRAPGFAPGTAGVNDAPALHGRLYIHESDVRTWLSPAVPRHIPLCGRMEDAETFRKVTVRDFGRFLVGGHGAYWLDMQGGWFNDPSLMETISDIRSAFEKDLDRPGSPRADMAVFFSEQSEGLLDASVRRPHAVAVIRQQDTLNLSGVPYHFHLQQDVANPRLPHYKVLVFLNAYAISDAERAAIEKLKNDPDKTLVFLHAPGHGGASTAAAAAEAISKVTGMKIEPAGTRTLIAVPAEGMAQALGKSVPLSTETWAAPSFKVTDADPSVTPIATYADDREAVAAAVRVEPGKARVVFSGATGLTPEFYNLLAKRAGAWVAAPPGDGVFANQHWLVVHAASDGEKSITLAEKSNVTDMDSGEMVATEAVSFTTPSMRRGETRWYSLEPVSAKSGM